MELQIPEIILEDQYYHVLTEEASSMLEELKGFVKYKTSDLIDTGTKQELLIVAKSYGVERIFKRLPIDRGRSLLREFPYLLKSKGSEDAITRMAQIYLGVVRCDLQYDSLTKMYDLTNLYFKEISDSNDLFINSIYEALRYVNPIGRKLKELKSILEIPYISSYRVDTSHSLPIMGACLLGQRVQEVGNYGTVGGLKEYKVYPRSTNRDQLTSIYFRAPSVVSTKLEIDQGSQLEILDSTLMTSSYKDLGSYKSIDDMRDYKVYPDNLNKDQLQIVYKKED